MNFWQQRQRKKLAKHLLHEARHARAYREDVAAPADLAALDAAEQALKQALQEGGEDAFAAAAETLSRASSRVYPTPSLPVVREYVEIVAVALAAAMAFRTYFIQPFKIPTGSIQPTLYGVIVDPTPTRTVWDRFPLNIAQWALFGSGIVEVRARAEGPLQYVRELGAAEEGNFLFIGRERHFIRRGMKLHYGVGDYVPRGAVLASGRVTLGDHVFVNKVRYHFSRPKRGDIIVFDTSSIRHPDIKPDMFYIKRLVGLPGERIQIRPPYLVVNGVEVTEPWVFRRQVEREYNGVHGYSFAGWNARQPPKLGAPEAVLTLAADEFLPMGDNTSSSLDGRYFGGVKQESLVAPAAFVYWPLSPRWGVVH